MNLLRSSWKAPARALLSAQSTSDRQLKKFLNPNCILLTCRSAGYHVLPANGLLRPQREKPRPSLLRLFHSSTPVFSPSKHGNSPASESGKDSSEKWSMSSSSKNSSMKSHDDPSLPHSSKEQAGNKIEAKTTHEHWSPLTKAELLAAGNSFWERLKIRFKWLTIRQVRPFNTDDLSAFFSWIIVGNIIWILVGTTTFFSLFIFTLNTVSAQDYFAAWVGQLITRETGLKVVFEHAIVPHWSDGVISFRKVFVSRRPGLRNRNRVQRGSQAVAAAAAEAQTDGSSTEDPDDDGNYTQFDLTIDQVNVSLSLRKWMDGKGILKDCEVKGLRGVVDRRHVVWNPEDDAANYKNKHSKGDFEIEAFKMEDVMFTLFQPGDGVKPFDVSIFSCDLPQLRKHWLFYDFLNANHMSGSYDNSLFTIHPRQMTKLPDSNGDSPWKRITRLRIDGVDIRHLNRGVEGPFGWIESGNVDMIADMMLPDDSEDLKLSEVVQDIVERWEANLSMRYDKRSENTPNSSNRVTTTIEERARERSAHKYVVLDLRVQLNNTRAAVPLFTSDLTYMNNALIRPIVAYINSRDTYIPINCRVVKKLGDFEGSWTVYDSHLMDDISVEVYEAFARSVADDEERARRMRKVGFWSLQFAAQLFLLSLGAMA